MPARVQLAGRTVLLIPLRGPGMDQDARPPDYQRIMAVVRNTGGPVSTRQVGQDLRLEVTVRGKLEPLRGKLTGSSAGTAHPDRALLKFSRTTATFRRAAATG